MKAIRLNKGVTMELTNDQKMNAQLHFLKYGSPFVMHSQRDIYKPTHVEKAKLSFKTKFFNKNKIIKLIRSFAKFHYVDINISFSRDKFVYNFTIDCSGYYYDMKDFLVLVTRL